MPQRSIRFPEDLAARADTEAARLDRSFSWLVVQALEAALTSGSHPASAEQADDHRPVNARSASPRTPAVSRSAQRMAVATGRPAAHLPPCRCPVCKPGKGGKR